MFSSILLLLLHRLGNSQSFFTDQFVMSASDTWALVTHGPASGGQWKLQPVIPRELQEDEVLVRVVACGICLADVHVGDARPEEAVGNPGIWYPRVLGHEGNMC